MSDTDTKASWLTELYSSVLDECDALARAILEDLGPVPFGAVQQSARAAQREADRLALPLAYSEGERLFDPQRREQLAEVVGEQTVTRAWRYVARAYRAMVLEQAEQAGLPSFPAGANDEQADSATPIPV